MYSLQELTNLSDTDLKNELKTAVFELGKIQIEIRTGAKKGNHELRNKKKYIAQIKTILKLVISDK